MRNDDGDEVVDPPEEWIDAEENDVVVCTALAMTVVNFCEEIDEPDAARQVFQRTLDFGFKTLGKHEEVQ